MALSRRELMLCGAGGLACATFPTVAAAKVQVPLTGGPPLTGKADYIQWM
jgi:protein-L-isoaspartate(D-aspartate) O-methyltransferase